MSTRPVSPHSLDLADQLREWAGRALAALVRDQDRLNRINVYEIPDGDTGTNLVRTLGYGCSALTEVPHGLPATQMCADFATALWRNASGCSGLILASTLKPMLAAFADHGRIDVDGLVEGLQQAAIAAALAVARPMAGTMVTVVEEAARSAKAAAPDCVVVAEAVRAAGRAAVEKSQAQIPVLTRARVVDAGALGLSLVFDALCDVV